MWNVSQIKKEFPVFEKYPSLVFLDNASTTQKPRAVLKAMTDFYENDNANVNRGVYAMAERADLAYESARRSCAEFVCAEADEIVFVKNATEAANLVASSFGEKVVGSDDGSSPDNIVVTELEHHSNFLPWQELASRKGADLRIMRVDLKTGNLVDGSLKLIDENTKIVAVTIMSNVLGVMPDISGIVKAAHAVGAKVVCDAAQSAAHERIDVKKLDVDFVFVTGHKIFGPMGIGFLYGKKELLEKMPPIMTGGGMIKDLPDTWLDSPSRFEAGTPNVAGAVGLMAAIEFIRNLPKGWNVHEDKLAKIAKDKLSGLEKVHVFPCENSIVSFSIEGVHPHDIASILADNDICVRAGHHCAKPLMKALGVNATVRASFSIYNTEEDVDKLISAVKEVLNTFE